MARHLASLCSSCSGIFGSAATLDECGVYMEGLVDFTYPSPCNLCSIMWSQERHRFGRTELLGESYSYSRVWYRIMRMGSGDGSLGLHFAFEHFFVPKLVILPTHEGRLISCSQNLTQTTRSEASIAFLRSKLLACQESHAQCNRMLPSEKGWHPSRLLEVRKGNPHTLHLRNREEIPPTPYFTLSHCWGNSQPARLTALTEGRFRTGVPIDELPQTFRDAVDVCVNMSTVYLWIDSMCIFQDSLADWDKEAAEMRKVYSYASCNIAATGATDSSIGLFFDRDVIGESPFWIAPKWPIHVLKGLRIENYGPKVFMVPLDQWLSNVDRGPLNQRAWVQQERFLSRRIMHFTCRQIFWECLEDRSSELYPEGIPSFALPDQSSDVHGLKSILRLGHSSSREGREDAYVAWKNFLQGYTKCGLSVESDKFPAIKGIVEGFATIMDDTFVAGLWKSRLVDELCWRSSGSFSTQPQFSSKWRAPTWSWAKMDQAADLSWGTRCCLVKVEHIDFEANSSGQLKKASLTLRGQVSNGTTCSGGLEPIQYHSGKTGPHNTANVDWDDPRQRHSEPMAGGTTHF
ncbi:heterokaryon incompatibility protein-domain-containing protein [Clohesyomyces aquaticus]|uniref:Heterokaryon incompatibility protein-domain-containing protein n=1 Tax=Clohesyomyces aquaticus TaxID=1231657 RepID=A0A1Y1ZRS9_9PLEO|nr:heterokaryon incompatibility protein-domain-containing protein [Clohesyomyces aquaticus]